MHASSPLKLPKTPTRLPEDPKNISLREAVFPEAMPAIFAAELEVIVQANAADAVLGAPAEGYPEQRDGRGAGVHVKIFDLGAPVRRKHPFDAAAECPSCPGCIVANRHSKCAHGHFIVHVGKSAGRVDHDPIKCVSDAAPNGSEPGQLLVNSDAQRGVRAALTCALEVGFDSENKRRRPLPVVANLSAAEEAVKIRRASDTSNAGVCPSVAGVHANVETGPGKDGRIGHSLGVVARWNVSGCRRADA